MNRPILFLDLDGTIREPANGTRFINDPHDQQLIEGVKDAIAHYHHRYTIVGITNQGDVAARHKDLESAILEQQVTLELLPEIEAIYFCPDQQGEVVVRVSSGRVDEFSDELDPYCGTYRKPGSGMILTAIDDFNLISPNSDHWMIGDREEDALAATGAGVNFMWADVWRDRFKKGFGGVDLSDRHINRKTLLKFLAT